jgi:hypothetical protein
LTDNPRTRELLHHLATRPGHDEVKSDFRQLLVEEFGVELGALDFERRVPEVRGRIDALIGRTVFEAKRNLDQEWDDVVRRMPDYLADREREEGERFVGIASDGLKWVVFERSGDQLIKLKDTTLDLIPIKRRCSSRGSMGPSRSRMRFHRTPSPYGLNLVRTRLRFVVPMTAFVPCGTG